MSRIRLVLMTEEDYQQFIDWAIEDYAKEQVKAGAWLSEEALEQGKKVFGALLPEGLSTPDQLFYVIEGDRNNPVGQMWFGVRDEGKSRITVLYELVIYEEHRRRGYASQALLALEDKVRDQGLKQIILHVYGHNEIALYRKSGYVERNVTMVKEID